MFAIHAKRASARKKSSVSDALLTSDEQNGENDENGDTSNPSAHRTCLMEASQYGQNAKPSLVFPWFRGISGFARHTDFCTQSFACAQPPAACPPLMSNPVEVGPAGSSPARAHGQKRKVMGRNLENASLSYQRRCVQQTAVAPAPPVDAAERAEVAPIPDDEAAQKRVRLEVRADDALWRLLNACWPCCVCSMTPRPLLMPMVMLRKKNRLKLQSCLQQT